MTYDSMAQDSCSWDTDHTEAMYSPVMSEDTELVLISKEKNKKEFTTA